jgi:hypothetical protein
VTVAFDVATDGGNVTTNPKTFTHTPTGTPRAAIVLIVQGGNISADRISGVTYGGVSMTEVALSPVIKTTGEQAVVDVFFLGSGIPTGAQTVSITVSATTATCRVMCWTLISYQHSSCLLYEKINR